MAGGERGVGVVVLERAARVVARGSRPCNCRAVHETPGVPPDQRAPNDPAFVVTFTTRPAPPTDIHAQAARAAGIVPLSGYTTAPPPTGNYADPLDPTGSRPVPRYRSQMSPNGGDNTTSTGGPNGTPGGPASGSTLPAPGTVTHAMLAPLDTPEVLAERPKAEAALLAGLQRAYPKLALKSVVIERDPATLAERVTVHLNRRVADQSCSAIERDLRHTLSSKIPAWATMEASGVVLTVVDDSPAVAMTGTEQDDEVNFRSLPAWPKAYGAPRTVGTKVAFRGPLWNELFGFSTSEETDRFLAPYNGEVLRIRAKLFKLLSAPPVGSPALVPLAEHARVGTLVGLDPITDHACVEVQVPSHVESGPMRVETVNTGRGTIQVTASQPVSVKTRTFYIHCHPSWLIVWNVPPPAPQLSPPALPASSPMCACGHDRDAHDLSGRCQRRDIQTDHTHCHCPGFRLALSPPPATPPHASPGGITSHGRCGTCGHDRGRYGCSPSTCRYGSPVHPPPTFPGAGAAASPPRTDFLGEVMSLIKRKR